MSLESGEVVSLSFFGCCSSLMAEIWSIFVGLKLVDTLGYVKVEVETDSKTVVDSVMQRDNKKLVTCNLVLQIRSLMAKFEVVELHHNFRETNKCVNILAKEGKSLKGDTIFYQEIPRWLVHLVERDTSGEYSTRIVVL
ncbi:unnamed protein product [Vicia faba]|uniref:RNase H type-1 domain-containing protein n=1 Tax=Vicia faba TaxID=3906 RepID=A0AAV0YYZ4_VICFA|nr:unnamed protein product [Vicia faba]